MSNNIDRQIKIKMLLELADTIKGVDALADKIKRLGQAGTGEVSKSMAQIAAGAKKSADGAKAAKEAYKSLEQQVRDVIKVADEEYQAMNKVGKGTKGIFEESLRTLVDFKRQLGTLSIGAEKSIYSNLRRTATEGSDAYKILTEQIRRLNMEKKLETEQTKAGLTATEQATKAAKELAKAKAELAKTGKSSDMFSFNQMPHENTLTTIRSNIKAIESQIGSELVKNNNLESQRTTELRRQKTELEQMLVLIKKGGMGSTMTYQQKLGQLESKAMEQFRTWKSTDNKADKLELDKTVSQMRMLNKESVEFKSIIGLANRGFYSLNENASYFAAKMRSHITWMGTGAAIGGMLAAPTMLIDTITNVEKAMAGMMQVVPNLHKDQQALNEETNKFLDLAATYGEKIDNIIESGKLWGRMYGQIADGIGIVNTLTRQSSVLAVADNMNLVEANKSLESAMFQFGLVAKNSSEALAYSGRIIDVWTKLAHTAGVSAQDLTQAVERSGSVARMTGVDFEFLNAMVATGVRATGRSGAEIGNMIKSVLGSFHSKKAVAEIEALGVAVKQVGKDGQVEFRKGQDVLLDLSLAAQGTEKNLEELFKQVGGGKWQWSKVSAMLGDYQEFIRTWGESVNSTGFAAEQVKMQLDTISRKTGQLTADMQKLAVGGGNAGLTQYLKEQIQGVDNFIVALQKIPTSAWQVMGAVAQIAPIVYLAKKAWDAYTISVIASDAAQTALARKNLIVLVLTAISYAVYMAAESYGALENKARKAAEQTQDALAIKTQELEMYKQQGEFIDSLISAHNKMSQDIESGTLSTEKAALAEKNRNATVEELKKVIGEAGVANLEAAGWSEEAANTEKAAHTAKANSIKAEIATLKAQQIEYTRQQIRDAQERMDTLASETDSWGILARAQAAAMDIYAGILEKQIEVKKQMFNNVPSFMRSSGVGMQLAESISSDEEYRESLRGYRPESVNNEISGLANQIRELKLKVGQQELSTIDFSPPKSGGDNYEPIPGKQPKGSSATAPRDNTERVGNQLAYLELKKREEEINLKLKQSEDNNAIALDKVNEKEKLYGNTIESTLEKRKANQEYIDKLTTSLNDRTKLENDIRWQLGQEMANLGTISNADFDKKNTKDQRNLIKDNKEVLQANQSVSKLYELWTKVSEEISNGTKNIEKHKTALYEPAESGWYSDEKIYQRKLEADKRKQQSEILKVTNPYDSNNYRALDNINLAHAKSQRDIENERLSILTSNYNKRNNDLLNYKGNDEVKKLKLQSQVEAARIAMEKQVSTVEEADNQIKELERDKNKKITEGWYDVTDSLLLKGNSFRSIWANLWKQLAEDALKALMRIPNSNAGFLANLLGQKSENSNPSTGTKTQYKFPQSSLITTPIKTDTDNSQNNIPTQQKKANNNFFNSILSLLGLSGHAEGGIFDKEHIARFAEGNKKEAVIPLEDNKDRGKQLWLQSGNELGMFGKNKGSEVVPYLKNPEVAQKASEASTLRQSNAKLEELTEQQLKQGKIANDIMILMLNNLSNNKSSGGVAQPIVIEKSMSQDELYNMMQKIKGEGYRF